MKGKGENVTKTSDAKAVIHQHEQTALSNSYLENFTPSFIAEHDII